MMKPIQRRPLFYAAILLALAPGCHQRKGDSTPDIVLSESDEGVPPEPRLVAVSTGRSGDTLVCEKHRKYPTAEGDRWLWVRVLVERKPGSDTDNSVAETVVSTDSEGRENNQRVALAGISLDRDKDYTLRDATGVRTRGTKKSPKQAHAARGYTRGPDMGPLEASCGR